MENEIVDDIGKSFIWIATETVDEICKILNNLYKGLYGRIRRRRLSGKPKKFAIETNEIIFILYLRGLK